MPFQLTDVVLDPDMGQALTILRTTGTFVSGGFLSGPAQQIPTWGVIEVDQDMLNQMVPEGDRITGAIGVYLPIPIYNTHLASAPITGTGGPGISDQILWQGYMHSVSNVGPWGDFGYWFALLLRIAGF